MRKTINLNFDWDFCKIIDNDLQNNVNQIEKVDIPHHAVMLPLNHFNESDVEGIFLYYKTFEADPSWVDKDVSLRFEGVAHIAKVYINNQFVFEHIGGYTPFEFSITPFISYSHHNTIKVEVDSHEYKHVPPFGHVVDYLGYCGIYREVSLEIKEKTHIKDVFFYTKQNSEVHIEIELSNIDNIMGIEIYDSKNECVFKETFQADSKKIQKSIEMEHPILWDLENPHLYTAHLFMYQNEIAIDKKVIKFGIREAEFRPDGFYLNQKRIKLIGLNRHQSYPYVGYAMPKSAQVEDADLLKFDVGVQIVRTSHYPQSVHFLNRCDEIGLLVFEEIPGWQHIGDSSWKSQTIETLKEMIVRDRNHPSIIIWGVRINESMDDHEFYLETNSVAKKLDPSRQTGGVRNIKFSEFLEDVFTYNDFSHTGNNEGIEEKQKITSMDVPYLITEHNGHMFPVKRYDNESLRLQQAIRHMKVINDTLNSDNHISGTIGWCMNDYNTHKEFGAGDRICYHGVYDMFRIPKLASSVYRSQSNSKPILELGTTLNFGDHPGGYLPYIMLFTNVDYIKFYRNHEYVGTFYADKTNFKYLKFPPIIIDDYIGDAIMIYEKIEKNDANILKEVLREIGILGSRLAEKTKDKIKTLSNKYHWNENEISRLFHKYATGWGTKKTHFLFEGYIKDELSISRVIDYNQDFEYNITFSRHCLEIAETYDVSRVLIRKTNEHNHVAHYCFDAFQVETEGGIELIGPNMLTFIAGEAAFWIKSRYEGSSKIKFRFLDQHVEKIIEVRKLD